MRQYGIMYGYPYIAYPYSSDPEQPTGGQAAAVARESRRGRTAPAPAAFIAPCDKLRAREVTVPLYCSRLDIRRAMRPATFHYKAWSPCLRTARKSSAAAKMQRF